MHISPSSNILSSSRRFIVLLCCILFLLSSCGGSAGIPSPFKGTTGSDVANTSPAAPKSDMNGIETNAKLRAQLTKVDQFMQGMSLDEKLGQLIMVEYFGRNYANTELPYMIGQQHVGSFLYQEANHNFEAPSNTIDTSKQVTVQANSDAKIPLLIAVDQEGGVVNKLYTFYGDQPSAFALAATGDPNQVKAQGVSTAKGMQALGINVDLAPVVDVGPTSNLLQTRQFSDDPKAVTTYAGAFVDGLQSNGIIGTLKHFPGLGSIVGESNDPHTSLPVINKTMADLEATDFAPYKTLIKQNHPAMIMATNVVDTAIDPDLPAELSPKTINGILRGELGYNGVVITDGLYMGGIQQHWSISRASVLAIIAGNDIVEGAYHAQDVASTIQAFKEAIQQGQLTVERVNQSVQRILLMKVQYGIIK